LQKCPHFGGVLNTEVSCTAVILAEPSSPEQVDLV